MLSPSLLFHYRILSATTTKSAPCISLTSFKCLLPLTILQNDTEFTCSLIQPEYKCCQLNPGCHISCNQIIDMLCHKYKRSYLFLTSFIAFTRLLHWFIFIQLLYSHLQKSLFPFFFIAHNKIVSKSCCIKWFSKSSEGLY